MCGIMASFPTSGNERQIAWTPNDVKSRWLSHICWPSIVSMGFAAAVFPCVPARNLIEDPQSQNFSGTLLFFLWLFFFFLRVNFWAATIYLFQFLGELGKAGFLKGFQSTFVWSVLLFCTPSSTQFLIFISELWNTITTSSCQDLGTLILMSTMVANAAAGWFKDENYQGYIRVSKSTIQFAYIFSPSFKGAFLKKEKNCPGWCGSLCLEHQPIKLPVRFLGTGSGHMPRMGVPRRGTPLWCTYESQQIVSLSQWCFFLPLSLSLFPSL